MTPAKKRRNSWIAGLLVVSPFVWTVPTFFYLRADTKAKNVSCESNLKSLNNIMDAHLRQHHNFLPDTKTWQTLANSQKADTLHCPADPVSGRNSSYAFNTHLSGKQLSQIQDPQNVILIYESNNKTGTPFGNGKDLVNIGKEKAGQGRHNHIAYRFNYFLMADGSIREAGTADEMKPLRWKP